MSNESKHFFIKKEEEKKLVALYRQLMGEEKNESDEPTHDVAFQKKFIFQLLNTKISQTEPEANEIKNLNNLLRIAVMVLSGLATVLLGLKFGTDNNNNNNPFLSANFITNTTLIITAIVTFLSGLAVFWDTETYWIRKKIMLNKLKELRYEYAYFLAGDGSSKPGGNTTKPPCDGSNKPAANDTPKPRCDGSNEPAVNDTTKLPGDGSNEPAVNNTIKPQVDGSNKPDELKKFLDKFLACLGDEYWEKFLKDVNKNG